MAPKIRWVDGWMEGWTWLDVWQSMNSRMSDIRPRAAHVGVWVFIKFFELCYVWNFMMLEIFKSNPSKINYKHRKKVYGSVSVLYRQEKPYPYHTTWPPDGYNGTWQGPRMYMFPLESPFSISIVSLSLRRHFLLPGSLLQTLFCFWSLLSCCRWIFLKESCDFFGLKTFNGCIH